ncbi:Aste57867_4775 [Aphanomyces stellatus]|uniref:Aste57867_4775 protein n=1 Tax=Aphanomyces stellatus TaxID=120398 RepID=A0A485KGW6_9STRA|nr:hypothetical protein As57867_004762 [Aphanomyces stellatus]VFT81870.1 Aste57867_4775 [Aphanomyces stellatus]
MTAVSPHESDLSAAASPRLSRRDWVPRVVGLACLGVSAAMTAKYMTILGAYVQNDYFWTDFNASGTQTFVADVFNRQLWNTTRGARDLNLFSIDAASEKDYSKSDTLIIIQSTDARRIAMEQLDKLQVAIAGLRSQTTAQSARTMTSFCWLDFGREWQVAHTTARQARCDDRYASNGVVYMESMLRNTDWMAWSAVWGVQFQIAFGSAIDESAGGPLWFKQTTRALSTYTIDAEVLFWMAHNITQYRIPWHNRIVGGFDNAIVLRSAQQSFSIPLSRVKYQVRTGFWTSVIASIGLYNDFKYTSEVNASLVRNATNSATKLDESHNIETWTGYYPGSKWIQLLHDRLGPLASIDLMYVVPPSSFVSAYTKAATALLGSLQENDQLFGLFHASSSSVTFAMVPPSWQLDNVQYYGGSPLCFNGKPRTYIQQAFGYDDGCKEPYPAMTVHGDIKNSVLALLFQPASAGQLDVLSQICALNRNNSTRSCQTFLAQANELHQHWLATTNISATFAPDVALVVNDLLGLDIRLIQFASTNATNSVILSQPLVDPSALAWSFYGWLHLFEWLQGIREVVSFEGDVATYVLISQPYAPSSFLADPLQVPNRFSYVLWFVMLYMCFLSGAILVVVLVAAFFSHDRNKWRGFNLCYFNPVVGIVWIGRPLLIARGLTAMALLCSANIHLAIDGGFTYIKTSNRPFVDAVVLSSEVLWLTYAIVDTLFIVTQKYSFSSTLISCMLVWVCTLVLDLASPFTPTANLRRTCVSTNMEAQVSCISGEVEVGSSSRFLVLCGIQGICIVLSNVMARGFSTEQNRRVPVAIPSVASHLLLPNESNGLYFDPPSSIMCGIIPVTIFQRRYIFCVDLWLVISLDSNKTIFRKPTVRCTTSLLQSPTHSDISVSRTKHATQKLLAVASGIFLLWTAISSVLFFYVVQTQLSNDFVWEGFNCSGLQSFLIDWYNSELVFQPSGPVTLDLNRSTTAKMYNSTSSTVSSTLVYPDVMQYEQLSLTSIILGLRASDACQLPWVATQYCWVDFKQRWDMANSAQRQRRCLSMSSNGAVYVEALFRNANSRALALCWGEAIKIGLNFELSQSLQGREWMATNSRILALADEVTYWRANNVTQFIVQWQNYKALGVLETLMVESAFGTRYPLTLKSSSGVYRFSLQTSMKMYWGWGSDLWAITQANSTLVGEKGLIRSSSNFAFANVTMEMLLITNQTLAAPLDAGLTLIRDTLGPFGSIDLMHIPCPVSLLQLVKSYQTEYISVLSSNTSAQVSVVGSGQSIFPVPKAWLATYKFSRGGNALCSASVTSIPMQSDLFTWLSKYAACDALFAEVITTSQSQIAMTLISWGIFEPCTTASTCLDLSLACENTAKTTISCYRIINPVRLWVVQFFPPATLTRLFQQAQVARQELAGLDIEIVQYAQRNTSSPIELLRMNVFDPADPYFQLFAWFLMQDWAAGLREVVSLQGDVGSINVLSTVLPYSTTTPNVLEIPTNASYYCQLCVQYTTAIMFLITFFVLAYVVACRGLVEGLNMLEINRVGGIVWVGRPLLFLRSVVAILFLSTAKAHLQISGPFTKLVVPDATGIQRLTTVLAGSETCWLVVVLTDLFMLVTKDHTDAYSLKSSLIASLCAIGLSALRPIEPTFQMARTCDVVQMDFQLTCHAGVVQIGSTQRLIQLVVATSSIIVICFVCEYAYHPTFKLPRHNVSLLLPAGAHYLFHKHAWIVHEVLFMDKASAFMCGLVAATRGNLIYVLDIKTWRAHTISIDNPSLELTEFSNDEYDHQRFGMAVPMVV